MENVIQVNDQLSSRDLFEAFKLQLAKDFVQSNFDADFIKALKPDYSAIHKNIVQALQRSEKRADAKLMQLLYRIDISESRT